MIMTMTMTMTKTFRDHLQRAILETCEDYNNNHNHDEYRGPNCDVRAVSQICNVFCKECSNGDSPEINSLDKVVSTKRDDEVDKVGSGGV